MPPQATSRPTGLGRALLIAVDGVLHPENGHFLFVPQCLEQLRAIIEQTGATVVLTSFWQSTAAARAQVNEALRRWGLPPVGGCTVHGTPGSGISARASEILTWTRKRGHAACANNWVVLDHDPLDLHGLPERHFVRCDGTEGTGDAPRGWQNSCKHKNLD